MKDDIFPDQVEYKRKRTMRVRVRQNWFVIPEISSEDMKQLAPYPLLKSDVPQYWAKNEKGIQIWPAPGHTDFEVKHIDALST